MFVYQEVVIENGPVLVDLLIKDGDFQYLGKRSPEGNILNLWRNSR